MKKKFVIAMTALCLAMPFTGNADIFKKIGKALDKVDKAMGEVNKAVGNNSTSTTSTTRSGSTYSTIPGIDIQLTSCQRWGNGALIKFKLTNNSGYDKSLKFNFAGDPCDSEKPEPIITDNLGNSYAGGPTGLGNDGYISVLGYLYSEVPNGITVNGVFEVASLNPQSESFNRISIGGVDCSNSRAPFEYNFANIPISQVENTNSNNVTCTLPTAYIAYKGLTRVGNNVVLSFTFTNNSQNEINGYDFSSSLNISDFSSDGDSYKAKFSNSDTSNTLINFPSEIPVKCTLTLLNVPQNVTSFSLIRLEFLKNYKIEFKNISL